MIVVFVSAASSINVDANAKCLFSKFSPKYNFYKTNNIPKKVYIC